MTLKVKQSGSWNNIADIYAKASGAWSPVKEAYQKISGVWTLIYQAEQQYTINSTTDLVLADYLSGQGASTSSDIRIRIPSGAVIGSTSGDTAALRSGDLSSYQKVIVEIAGEVQGKGGSVSGADGGDAISATSAFSLHIMSGGAVRGGGGAGGQGGLGAEGSQATSIEGPYYSGTAPRYSYVYGPDTLASWWNGSTPFTNYTFARARYVGGKWYWPGASSGSGGWYYIYRGNHATGTRGTGGAGGVGQGYSQTNTSGSGGTAGTYRAGTGGTGGNGGTWATGGTNGSSGGNGLKITESGGYSTLTYGSGGNPAGIGGNAVSASGLTLPFLNEGTVNGSLNFTQDTYDG